MPGDRHAINLYWLLRLRWGAGIGQLLIIGVTHFFFGIRLELFGLLCLVALGFSSNAAAVYWLKMGRGAGQRVALILMALDVGLLTGLLQLSGGPFNPFSSLYLVNIALAAVVLKPKQTWALAALSLACFGGLFVVRKDFGGAHHDHMRLHLEGMWLAFGVAAAFIVYFVQRVTSALAKREQELAATREISAKSQRLASLATLAAGAAHELATPLSTIAVVANELQRRLESWQRSLADKGDPALPSHLSELLEDANLVRQEVRRCREILDQMTADAGGSPVESMVLCRPTDVVQASMKGLKEANRVELCSPDLGPSIAARLPCRALGQTLGAVLKNALQASPGRAVKLKVNSDKNHWHFTVEDCGEGMSQDVLARVGEPFFTTKEPGRGMGLGLFLARIFLERLGGSLDIDSVQGSGTTVHLCIPVAIQLAGLSASTAAPDPGNPSSGWSASVLTGLGVDGTPAVKNA